MTKWILYVVLGALVAGSWYFYAETGKKIERAEAAIIQAETEDDYEERLPKLQQEVQSLQGERTFNGILLTFLSAGLVGIFVVAHLLPMLAQRMTHAVYDSAEEVEPDALHDAHSLLAQGEYEAAIEAFGKAAEEDPTNRVPWIEIAKIQKDHYYDPVAAAQTLRGALEGHEWQENDAAFFMFRLAEIYYTDLSDPISAVSILQQVTEQFPDSRHAANARHKLNEWKAV